MRSAIRLMKTACIGLAACASVSACSDDRSAPDTEVIGTTQQAVGLAVPPGIGLEPDKLYLTFDDGPSATNTPKILDILRDHKDSRTGEPKPIKATFFITGINIEGNEDLIKREIAEGHTIAQHQWEHVQASTAQLTEWVPKEQRLLDMIIADSQIAAPPKYFRYPFGSGTLPKEGILKANGFKHGGIGWNMDSLDWCYGGKFNPQTAPNGRCARPEAIDKVNFMNHVKKHVDGKGGKGVLLFHDIQRITAFHLEELLAHFESRGFQIGGGFPLATQQ
jgi:peptidoglycan-N-acetylglucosamine deacetylase